MPGLKAMRRERNRLLVLQRLHESPATDHELMARLGYQVTSAVAKKNLRALMSDMGGDCVQVVRQVKGRRGDQRTWAIADGMVLCECCEGRGLHEQ